MGRCGIGVLEKTCGRRVAAVKVEGVVDVEEEKEEQRRRRIA